MSCAHNNNYIWLFQDLSKKNIVASCNRTNYALSWLIRTCVNLWQRIEMAFETNGSTEPTEFHLLFQIHFFSAGRIQPLSIQKRTAGVCWLVRRTYNIWIVWIEYSIDKVDLTNWRYNCISKFNRGLSCQTCICLFLTWKTGINIWYSNKNCKNNGPKEGC